MKSKNAFKFVLVAALLAATLPTSLAAADLAQLVATAAKWESGQNAEPIRQLERLVSESADDRAQRAEIEAALLKLLSPASTFEARRFACQQLAIAGSDASVPALAKLLQDPQTIGIACLAFGNRPSARVDETLRAALPGAQSQGRLQIISTLGNRRDAKSVELLAGLSREADLAVAQTAVEALGRIANEAARKAIAALRKEAKVELVGAVADASLRCADELVKVGDPRSAAAIYEYYLAPAHAAFVRRGAFAGLLRCEPDGGQGHILRILRSDDSILKPVAILAVCDLPSRTASEKFGEVLPALGAEEQAWLIDSLAARGDSAARSVITAALANSADSSVRKAAAQALGRKGDAGSVKPLVRALASAKDEAEARSIESALAALPAGRDTDKAMLTELKASQGKVRAQLISSLAARRSPAILAALFVEAENPDPSVAKAAYRVLARAVTAGNLPTLLTKFGAIQDADRRSDAETFVEQAVLNVENPGDRSTAVRGALSRASNLATRLALLRMLPACGDGAALNVLKSAKSDADARVREAAVNAFAEWPDDSAWDALMVTYRQPETEVQHGTALRGMARLMSEGKSPLGRQVQRYEDLLGGVRGDADLKLILGAMGSARNPGVLKLALPLLDQPAVRAEAEVAVRKIAGAIKDKDPAAAKEALERITNPR